MKSTNSNNSSEEVIQLLSHNLITQNQIDDENVGFIKAEVTSVLANDSENVTILSDDGAVGTTASSSDGLLHDITQQDSNDLPEILRNMTWNDPFYESMHDRNNIIMAFDIDRTKYDRFALPRVLGIVCTIIAISVYFHLLDFLIGVSFFLVLSVIIACCMDCDQRSNQFRAKRVHIALTRNGVCIDKVATPGGDNLMMRKKILYKKMKKCCVKEEYNCFRNTSNYTVEILLLVEGSTFCVHYQIEDLARPQQFVDVVNAMIEKSNKATTEIEIPTIPN